MTHQDTENISADSVSPVGSEEKISDEAIGRFLASVFGFPLTRGGQVLNALREEGVDVEIDLSDADLTIEGACAFGASGELFLKRFRVALPILLADYAKDKS